MLVKDCMTHHPIMISANTPAVEAQRIMSENKVRHLPVVGDGKRLEGLVTRQTLSLRPDTLGSVSVWEISRYLAELRSGNLMIPLSKVITVSPNITVERAARTMADHKIGCLPVVEEHNVVVGIISEIDVLYVLQEMLGLPSDGVRATMRMPNDSGEFAKLTAVLAKHDIGVMGIGTHPTPRREGYWDCVLKIRNVSEEDVRAALETVVGQELVDLRSVV